MDQAFSPPEVLKECATIKRHIDGPVLMWAGLMEWLTWRQRITIWLGLTTAQKIARQTWPNYAQWHE